MPTILTRAVLREVTLWYVAGVLLFFSLQMTDALASTVSRIMTYDPPLGKAVAAFAAYLPSVLNKTLAAAVPFAVLLTFSRMQRDSELKAAHAAGVRPLSLVWPLLLPFAVVSVLAFWNTGTLVPAGLKNWDRAWFDIYGQAVPPATQDSYTYAPPGALYHAGRVQTADDNGVAPLSGVMVQRGTETLTAQSGSWDTRKQTWTLTTPWVVKPGERPRQLPTLTVPQNDVLRPPPPDPKQVSNAELRATLERPDLRPAQQRDYQFQFWQRLADPVTPMVFALAAGALGLLIRNRAAAFAAVLVFIVCFYALWVTMPTLARAGALDPALAAWLPNAAFLLLAGALAWRLR